MEKKTTAAAIVDCLRSEGINTVFGLPGSQILPLIDELHQANDMEFITTHNEHNASFAAYGYAAAKGGPAACISTLGPGSMNLIAGVTAAYKAAIPIIAFTAKGPLKFHQRDYFQEIDEVSIYRPVTKWSYMITNPEEVPRIIKKAFRVALSGRPGPVHLSIPAGTILPEQIPCDSFEPRRYRGTYQQPFVAFEQKFGNELYKILTSAKFPVILAGDEVRWEGAEIVLREFVELTNIPVVTPLHFPDILTADHPLYLGNLSTDGWECANKALKLADVVFVLGTHLDYLTTKFNPEFFAANTRVIQVSNYPERIGAVYAIDIGVICKARAFLEGTKLLMQDKGLKRDVPPEIAELKSDWLAKRKKWSEMKDMPIKPQFVAFTMRKSIPKGTAIVGEGGNFVKFVRACTDPDGTRSFFIAENYGAVGSGFPIAMGVKAADPSRPVIAALGDGGMMLSGVSDFETAVRAKLPFVSVIFNDSGFGNIRAYQQRDYGGRFTCDFNNPDFGELAKLHGGWGIQVGHPKDLGPAIRKGFEKGVPALIDVKIDPFELGMPAFTPQK